MQTFPVACMGVCYIFWKVCFDYFIYTSILKCDRKVHSIVQISFMNMNNMCFKGKTFNVHLVYC